MGDFAEDDAGGWRPDFPRRRRMKDVELLSGGGPARRGIRRRVHLVATHLVVPQNGDDRPWSNVLDAQLIQLGLQQQTTCIQSYINQA